MVNTRALKGVFVTKGYTQSEIARELGISSKTMTTRMKTGVFGSDEISKMIDLLEIKDPMEIFFADKVSCYDTK